MQVTKIICPKPVSRIPSTLSKQSGDEPVPEYVQLHTLQPSKKVKEKAGKDNSSNKIQEYWRAENFGGRINHGKEKGPFFPSKLKKKRS